MNIERQNEIKQYIPLKAIILFDRLMIADVDDNWHTYDPAGEKEYILQYRGKNYKFTLSDQIFDLESETWITAGDIGLESKDRKAIVTEYIISQLNSFWKIEQAVITTSWYSLWMMLQTVNSVE